MQNTVGVAPHALTTMYSQGIHTQNRFFPAHCSCGVRVEARREDQVGFLGHFRGKYPNTVGLWGFQMNSCGFRHFPCLYSGMNGSNVISMWNYIGKSVLLQSSHVFWPRNFRNSGRRIFTSTDFEVCGDKFSVNYPTNMEYTLMFSSPSRTVLRTLMTELPEEDETSPMS